MFESPTEMEITSTSSFTRFTHSAAASRLCPLMSLLLDSSQCRRLVSSHPLWIVCTSTTHDSSLFNSFLPALRVSRVVTTPTHQMPCVIEFLAESITVRLRANTKVVHITGLVPLPQTSHFHYSYMHTHTHTHTHTV